MRLSGSRSIFGLSNANTPDSMPNVVITGGPGAGKTTLLAELAAMGYKTVNESARAIIAERLASGASPRPDALAFTREILRRDIESYVNVPHGPDWVFFDRGVVEAIGMLQEIAPPPEDQLRSMLSAYRFYSVFVLPPWEAIYTRDSERDQSFADAVIVYDKVVRWYRACGYELHEVPPGPVAQRAAHVLRILEPKNA